MYYINYNFLIAILRLILNMMKINIKLTSMYESLNTKFGDINGRYDNMYRYNKKLNLKYIRKCTEYKDVLDENKVLLMKYERMKKKYNEALQRESNLINEITKYSPLYTIREPSKLKLYYKVSELELEVKQTKLENERMKEMLYLIRHSD